MAFSDPPNDLEHLIADAMGPALEDARRSLAEQIRKRSEGDARAARERGLHELRASVARLDAARDQSEVLQTLLEEAARFAGRTALLLTFVDGARGWAAHGFGGGARSVEDLRLGYDEPFLRELAQGRGTVALDGTQAAALAERLGGGAPHEAVLVPLVLRDRVAAALYADRVRDEDALLTSALQLLTLTAAHLLELQGTRERASTPTLAGAGAATAMAAAGLALWDPAAVERAAPARPEPAAAAVATPEELAAPEMSSEVAPAVVESAQPAVEEPVSPGWEPSPSSPPEPAWVETPSVEPEPQHAAPEPQWQMDEEPTAATFAPAASAVEPTAAEEPWVYTDHAAAGAEATSYEEVEAQAYTDPLMEELPALPEPELDALPEVAPEEEPPAEPPAAEPDAGHEPWREPTESWSTPIFTPPDTQTSQLYPSAPEPSPIYPSEATVRISRDLLPTAAAPAAPAPPPAPEADISDDRTVMLHRQEAAAPPPAPAPAPPARDELDETHTRPQVAQPRQAPVFGGMAGGGSTEVQPPPDLEGPGWAFRSEPGAAATAPHRQMNEETSALHEEARRLARLLVSEIKLYNEEQVEEGRRQRDIYPRLQEDIDRSRQMYEERVDPRVRGEVDYFQQEVVNILAGGDAGALGL